MTDWQFFREALIDINTEIAEGRRARRVGGAFGNAGEVMERLWLGCGERLDLRAAELR